MQHGQFIFIIECFWKRLMYSDGFVENGISELYYCEVRLNNKISCKITNLLYNQGFYEPWCYLFIFLKGVLSFIITKKNTNKRKRNAGKIHNIGIRITDMYMQQEHT